MWRPQVEQLAVSGSDFVEVVMDPMALPTVVNVQNLGARKGTTNRPAMAHVIVLSFHLRVEKDGCVFQSETSAPQNVVLLKAGLSTVPLHFLPNILCHRQHPQKWHSTGCTGCQ